MKTKKKGGLRRAISYKIHDAIKEAANKKLNLPEIRGMLSKCFPGSRVSNAAIKIIATTKKR